MLFSFSEFYPNGGLSDVLNSFDTLQECMNYIENQSLSEFSYIFDRIEGIITKDLCAE